MKFSAWALFVPVWLLLVLCPVFKVVFGGYFYQRGSLDFAGGTAIHVNAGIAALAVALLLGRRANWPSESSAPHSMPLVMLGTGILCHFTNLGAASGIVCSSGGGLRLLGEQLFANAGVAVYSFGVTLLILLALKRMIGIRVSEEVETAGIDRHLHNEIAYDFGALVGWITSNGENKVDAELESELEFAEGERELEELDRETV